MFVDGDLLELGKVWGTSVLVGNNIVEGCFFQIVEVIITFIVITIYEKYVLDIVKKEHMVVIVIIW